MLIYLVRHGEAKEKSQDPERGLTEGGKEDVRKMGVFISIKNLKINRILHSTKKRARETAEILAEHLNPKGGTSEEHGLEPMSDPDVWHTSLSDLDEDVMIVGHLPYLGDLATLLITGDNTEAPLMFETGEVACIGRFGGKHMLMWKVGPDRL